MTGQVRWSQQDIYEYFLEAESDSLESAHEEFEGDYDEQYA